MWGGEDKRDSQDNSWGLGSNSWTEGGTPERQPHSRMGNGPSLRGGVFPSPTEEEQAWDGGVGGMGVSKEEVWGLLAGPGCRESGACRSLA